LQDLRVLLFAWYFGPLADLDNAGDTKALKLQPSTQFALTIECIWNLRNATVHNSTHGNAMSTWKGQELKILEHLQVYQWIPKIDVFPCAKWVPPLLHHIKINVDAAWSSSKATIAAIARDQHGLVLKACSIQLDASDPMVAEATAIRWALELASLEKF
jgi:hypothetical protein